MCLYNSELQEKAIGIWNFFEHVVKKNMIIKNKWRILNVLYRFQKKNVTRNVNEKTVKITQKNGVNTNKVQYDERTRIYGERTMKGNRNTDKKSGIPHNGIGQ